MRYTAAFNVTNKVLLVPVVESDAVLPARVEPVAWEPDTSVNFTVIEVSAALPTVSAVPVDPSKLSLKYFPVHAVVSSPVKDIVATLKKVPASYQVSVIEVVITLSHATAAWDPCPNSKLPVPIVTLAASVVATSGPIVAIRKPAIIFLLR